MRRAHARGPSVSAVKEGVLALLELRQLALVRDQIHGARTFHCRLQLPLQRVPDTCARTPRTSATADAPSCRTSTRHPAAPHDRAPIAAGHAHAADNVMQRTRPRCLGRRAARCRAMGDLFLGADHRLAAWHNLAALREESAAQRKVSGLEPRRGCLALLGGGGDHTHRERVPTLVKSIFGPFLPPRGQPCLRCSSRSFV